MRSLFLNDKLKLFTKVIIAPIITYMIVGAISSELLNYEDNVFEILGFKPMDEIRFSTILVGQLIRGFLLGVVVWLTKDSILGKKLAWLRLWLILVILGIFSTYGPVAGSIEGFIYLDLTRLGDLPLSMNLGIIEVLIQPLLFSVIVTFQRKEINKEL